MSEAVQSLNRQRISAGGIVIQDDKVLMVRLHEPGQYDFWVMPGGGIEGGEGIFRAAEREVWEETSLTVKAEKIAYVEELIDEGRYVCKFWVVCRFVSGNLSLEHKEAREACLQEARFFSQEELQGMEAFPTIVKDQLWLDLEAGFPTFRYLGYKGQGEEISQ